MRRVRWDRVGILGFDLVAWMLIIAGIRAP
jgi:hypothetical protein